MEKNPKSFTSLRNEIWFQRNLIIPNCEQSISTLLLLFLSPFVDVNILYTIYTISCSLTFYVHDESMSVPFYTNKYSILKGKKFEGKTEGKIRRKLMKKLKGQIL